MKVLACCVLSHKKLYGNCLHWLNILYQKVFHLVLKNRVCREIFYCIEYIFYHSGLLSNLRLSWKTEFAQKFFTVGPIEYTFTFTIFEQLALALKNRLCPELTVLNIPIFITQYFWASCACPEKHELPRNFSRYWNIFYHSGFLSNLRLPWKTDCALN